MATKMNGGTEKKAGSTKLERALVELLKSIYNNKDFVNGIMNMARDIKSRETILEFIQYAKRIGDVITSDHVIAVALKLKRDITK